MMTQGRRGCANLGLEADAPLGHSIRGARVRADGNNLFGIKVIRLTPDVTNGDGRDEETPKRRL